MFRNGATMQHNQDQHDFLSKIKWHRGWGKGKKSPSRCFYVATNHNNYLKGSPSSPLRTDYFVKITQFLLPCLSLLRSQQIQYLNSRYISCLFRFSLLKILPFLIYSAWDQKLGLAVPRSYSSLV